jgi:hypothetical protein
MNQDPLASMDEVSKCLNDLCEAVHTNDECLRVATMIAKAIRKLGTLDEESRMELLEAIYPEDKPWTSDDAASDLARLLERGPLYYVTQAKVYLTTTERKILNQDASLDHNGVEHDEDWGANWGQ